MKYVIIGAVVVAVGIVAYQYGPTIVKKLSAKKTSS